MLASRWFGVARTLGFCGGGDPRGLEEALLVDSYQSMEEVMSGCGLFPASLSVDFIRHEWLLQIAGC